MCKCFPDKVLPTTSGSKSSKLFTEVTDLSLVDFEGSSTAKRSSASKNYPNFKSAKRGRGDFHRGQSEKGPMRGRAGFHHGQSAFGPMMGRGGMHSVIWLIRWVLLVQDGSME